MLFQGDAAFGQGLAASNAPEAFRDLPGRDPTPDPLPAPPPPPAHHPRGIPPALNLLARGAQASPAHPARGAGPSACNQVGRAEAAVPEEGFFQPCLQAPAPAGAESLPPVRANARRRSGARAAGSVSGPRPAASGPPAGSARSAPKTVRQRPGRGRAISPRTPGQDPNSPAVGRERSAGGCPQRLPRGSRTAWQECSRTCKPTGALRASISALVLRRTSSSGNGTSGRTRCCDAWVHASAGRRLFFCMRWGVGNCAV